MLCCLFAIYIILVSDDLGYVVNGQLQSSVSQTHLGFYAPGMDFGASSFCPVCESVCHSVAK